MWRKISVGVMWLLVLFFASNIRAQTPVTITPEVTLAGDDIPEAIAWAPNSQSIALVQHSGISLYDLSLSETATIPFPDNIPISDSDLAWNADSSLLAYSGQHCGEWGDSQPCIGVWSVEQNTHIFFWYIADTYFLGSIEWNPHRSEFMVDGYRNDRWQLLVVSPHDAAISIVDLNSKLPETDYHKHWGWHWSWSTDGNTIVATSTDAYIVLGLDGNILDRGELPPYDEPDSVYIEDGIATVITPTGERFEYQNLAEGNYGYGLSDMIWAPDQQQIAFTNLHFDSELLVVDTESGKLRLRTHHLAFENIWFSPDSQWLLTWTKLNQGILYHLLTGERVAYRWHQWHVADFAFHPSGDHLLVSSQWSPDLYLWNTHTGSPERWYAGEPVVGGYYVVRSWSPEMAGSTSIAYNPTGEYIVTGGTQYNAQKNGEYGLQPFNLMIWDSATGAVVERIPLPEAEQQESDYVLNLQWSDDSRFIAWSTSSRFDTPNRIGAWDRLFGTYVIDDVFDGHIRDLVLHPTRQQVAYIFQRYDTQQTDLHVIDFQRGTTHRYPIQADLSIRRLDSDPTGHWLVGLGESLLDGVGHLSLWEWSPEGMPIFTFRTSLNTNAIGYGSLEWSPTNPHIAFGVQNDPDVEPAWVEVWEVDLTQRAFYPVATLSLDRSTYNFFSERVPRVQWSPDGTRIATSLQDGEVQIFSVP